MSAMIHVSPPTCNGKHHCSNSNYSMSCFMNTIARSHQRHDFASVSCITNRKCDSQSTQPIFNRTSRICLSTARLASTKSLLNSMRHLRESHVSCPAHPQRIPFLTKSLLSRVFQRLCTTSCNLMTNGFLDRNLLHIKILTHCDPSFFVEMDTAPFRLGARASPFFIISRKIPS